MTSTDSLVRRLALEGAQNFRDLGGYATADGRTVRWRRVYRADALHGLTPADVEALVALGLRAVFDLRSASELEHFGVNPLIARGVTHHHVPFMADVRARANRQAVPGAAEDRPRVSAEGYLAMIEHAKPSVARVFDTLAASTAESGAAVFHCTAGKDRTGMMAALLLSALGVPDDVIAEDYALTAQYLVYDEARTQVLREFYGLQVSPGAVSAAPETIHGLLSGLGERYGSVIGYLDDAGVTPGQLEALRDALLEAE